MRESRSQDGIALRTAQLNHLAHLRRRGVRSLQGGIGLAALELGARGPLALAWAKRFERLVEIGARLDLDEREVAAAARDEIDLALRRAKPPGDDPANPCENRRLCGFILSS